jgi:hypothetical protein
LGEPDPNVRDIKLYETILSGDLNGDDGPNFVNNGENSYHVFYHTEGLNLDKTAILDGFTITGGNANGSSLHNCGGGMYNKSSSPTVNNCTFNGNSAYFGGGMGNLPYSSPKVNNCTFIGNLADFSGGGMLNQYSSPRIINCTFSGNSAVYGVGGGMNNLASSPIVNNCTFTKNSANDGGGMYNGAAFQYYSSPRVINCTFSGNLAGRCGGGMCNGDSSPTVINCILWADTPSEIQSEIYNYSRTPVVRYSDVQGGWPGEGNINIDPCFADPDANDYHLKSQAGIWEPSSGSWVKDDVTSLCIDAGDPASPVGLEPFPNGGIINMGAYGGTAEASKSYFGEPVCETVVAGDINGDCIVNLKDFAFMAFHWLEEH